ncbi:MAG: hypothetical protein FK734_13345 [Asgard group archaeon]|nr:hypothetical protein [Asgard group archaeon]
MALRSGPGFEREVKEQIASSLPYRSRQEESVDQLSFGEALSKLKELGYRYANAHRALPAMNKVQQLAKDAAIAVGEFRFDDAIDSLSKLESILSQGPEVWQVFAQEGLDQ